MNEEIKKVAETLSDYASAEKEKMIKDIRAYSIMGTAAIIVYGIVDYTQLVLQNVIYEKIALYCETLAFVTIVMILAHTTGLISKIQKRQKNSKISAQVKSFPKAFQMIIAAIVAFVSATIIKLFLTGVLGI